MRIMLISDGSLPVPPKGWGALERAVWNYKLELEKFNHEVLISNHQDSANVLKDWRNFKPDVVHNHLGKHWEATSLIYGCKKIITNYGGAFENYKETFYKPIFSKFFRDCDLFLITDSEKEFYDNMGLWLNSKVLVLPSGVDTSLFSPSEKEGSGSIYLGQINLRKKQALYQKLGINCFFAGNPEDTSFNYSDPNYLGQWSHKQVVENLCKFNSLVLLSDFELQPFVCLEAMCSGLGLIRSKPASQSLDISKPWISLIPENKLNDIDYINSEIERINKIVPSYKDEIIEYGKTFDWSNIIKKYIDLIS